MSHSAIVRITLSHFQFFTHSGFYLSVASELNTPGVFHPTWKPGPDLKLRRYLRSEDCSSPPSR